MLVDINWVQYLDVDRILRAGEKSHWYPSVFIALIRQHYATRNIKDPITLGEFALSPLLTDNRDQYIDGFSYFVKACALFPIEVFIRWGKTEEITAKAIMQDIRNTLYYFALSAEMVKHYPHLAEYIAAQWKHSLVSVPFTSKE